MRGYYQISLRLYVVLTTLASLLIVWTHNLYGRVDKYGHRATDLLGFRLAAESAANIAIWATVILWTAAWMASGPRTES